MRVRATNISGQESARLSVPQAGKLTDNALTTDVHARGPEAPLGETQARSQFGKATFDPTPFGGAAGAVTNV
jgi:hypothetical protein